MGRKKATTAATTKYHIGLSIDSIGGAPLALLPGDPARAGIIAASLARRYGTKEIHLATRREFTSFLVQTSGPSVVVTSTGIGGPSTSIAVEELAQLGVRWFLRVGTTGAIQPHIKIGHVVITTGAVRLDGASRHYAPIEFPAVADHRMVASLVEAAKQCAIPYHVGVTASSDTFYPGEERSDSFRPYTIRALQGATREWKALGVLNYEMESATLLTMTASMGLAGGCVTGVVNRAQHGSIGSSALKKGVDAAVEVATTAVDYILERL